mgnify:CR=1 FL=1
MSDVFKNIADAAGSSSVRRGFADLFSASKAALDEIQAGLGGILPSMPGMPVAKFGDLSIGIDMHPTVTPPSPIMPVPHVGKVYDLMADLMAGMAAGRIAAEGMVYADYCPECKVGVVIEVNAETDFVGQGA